MKYLLPLFLSMSLNSWSAIDDQCHYPFTGDPIFDETNEMMLQKVNQGVKRDFKRRTLTTKGYHLGLEIETNFQAPLVGKDIYWGRIYFNDGDPNRIAYRDDLIAEKNYAKESKKPSSFNYSPYQVSDINSSKGLTLIEAAGAKVNVKSVGSPFSTTTGGRLAVLVKAPSENARTLVIDIARNKNQISKFLIHNNKRIAFDTFKINASKNFLGVTTILSGVDSIQFYSKGKLVQTIQ
jgi:hypothetical protein